MAVFLTTSFEGDNNFFIFFPPISLFSVQGIVKGKGYIFGQSLKNAQRIVKGIRLNDEPIKVIPFKFDGGETA